MQSKTSLLNPTLFRKNLTRFWPIWGLYGVLWLLLLPVAMLSEYVNGDMEIGIIAAGNVDSLVMSQASDASILLTFGFGASPPWRSSPTFISIGPPWPCTPSPPAGVSVCHQLPVRAGLLCAPLWRRCSC